MNKEEIYSVLDKMLSEPKSKTFLNHLVRAYMPVTKIHQVEVKPAGDFKCAITKQPLVSLSEIFQVLESDSPTIKESFHKSIISAFDKNSKETSTNPYKEILGDKLLGVTGQDTNTCMSIPASQAFYDWVISKSLKGDKHINWLLGSIKHSQFMKRAEGIEDPAVQHKVNQYKRIDTRVATFTLGETNDVLSKLKDKFKNN